MTAYVARRLAQCAIVILGVTALSFGSMFLTGDPAAMVIGQSNWSLEQIEEFRHTMGFDRPWLVQYRDFLWGVARGDLGQSLHYGQPVTRLIAERLPLTVGLSATAVILSVLIACPVGVLAAVFRNSFLDGVSRILALLGQAMPVFWFGQLLIAVFAVELRWLPVSGAESWRHLVLPTLTLALYSMGRTMRMVRASVLEVLEEDYVRTGRAKGLREHVVIGKHAMRNALIPVATLFGLEFGVLLGGAVITEFVFSLPGLGRLIVQAIATKDFPVVQGGVTYLALVFVGVNLAVDLSYALLDARIRYR